MKNKLLIFTFFDKDGIADRYVKHLLGGMKQCEDIKEILAVVNGVITDESKALLEEITPKILVRENKGYDTWAYKAGLDYYGRDKLEEFDEIILMNDSVFGPLYPFSEMFEEMDRRDADFWGMTIFPGSEDDPYGRLECGYMPEHIQSYFMAVRKKMHTSAQFKNYWDNLPEINSYADAVTLHEAMFTKRFEDAGFTWDIYIDTRNDPEFTDNPTIQNPLGLISGKRCPVIKKRCFYADNADTFDFTVNEKTIQAYEYIRDNLQYDVSLFWDGILRNLKRELDRIHARYAELTSSYHEQNAHYSAVKAQLEHTEKEYYSLQDNYTAMTAQRDSLQNQKEDLINQKEDLINQKEDLIKQRDHLQAYINGLENSVSWKITKPLRAVMRLIARKGT